MILVHVNQGEWRLRLPSGHELRGREATAGAALCKATAIAAKIAERCPQTMQASRLTPAS